MENYKICNRCVMDTSDKEIFFNEEGNCNHCENFLESTKKRTYSAGSSEKELENLVAKIKRNKGKYDCLVGVSGGVDSSFVLYKCKELGLNPLAVHMDNGWNSQEAVNNIRNLCEILNVDYMSYVLNWSDFRDLQLSFLKSSIPEVEIPTDIAILGVLHRVASKNNIKYIISGGNFSTEGILPNSWFYDPKDYKLLKSIQHKFGSKSLKTFPRFDYKKEIYYKLFKRIKMVYLLNYLDYDKKKVKEFLIENLKWKDYGGKHYESRYTGFVQSYLQPVKFNLDYRRATLSTEICMGKVSREEALEILKRPSFDTEKVEIETAYVCKKLNISKEEFNRILTTPEKTYQDYPNNENFLNWLYSLYHKYIS